MYPPSWACKQLYRIHPQLRVAWAGKPKRNPEDLNAGSFALVQLYHISDIGGLDDPITIRELWDTTTEMDEFGKPQRIRISRGPIFNKDGGSRRDWDPLFRIPVFVCTLDDNYDIDERGRESIWHQIIPKVHEWLTPIHRRIRESASKRGRELTNELEDAGREMGEHWWREANRADADTPLIDKQEAYEQNDWRRYEKNLYRDFSNEHHVPEPHKVKQRSR